MLSLRRYRAFVDLDRSPSPFPPIKGMLARGHKKEKKKNTHSFLSLENLWVRGLDEMNRDIMHRMDRCRFQKTIVLSDNNQRFVAPLVGMIL